MKGGKREGAGRPRLYNEKLIKITLWVTPQQKQHIVGQAKLRGESEAEYIRKVIDQL